MIRLHTILFGFAGETHTITSPFRKDCCMVLFRQTLVLSIKTQSPAIFSVGSIDGPTHFFMDSITDFRINEFYLPLAVIYLCKLYNVIRYHFPTNIAATNKNSSQLKCSLCQVTHFFYKKNPIHLRQCSQTMGKIL